MGLDGLTNMASGAVGAVGGLLGGGGRLRAEVRRGKREPAGPDLICYTRNYNI